MLTAEAPLKDNEDGVCMVKNIKLTQMVTPKATMRSTLMLFRLHDLGDVQWISILVYNCDHSIRRVRVLPKRFLSLLTSLIRIFHMPVNLEIVRITASGNVCCGFDLFKIEHLST